MIIAEIGYRTFAIDDEHAPQLLHALAHMREVTNKQAEFAKPSDWHYCRSQDRIHVHSERGRLADLPMEDGNAESEQSKDNDIPF